MELRIDPIYLKQLIKSPMKSRLLPVMRFTTLGEAVFVLGWKAAAVFVE